MPRIAKKFAILIDQSSHKHVGCSASAYILVCLPNWRCGRYRASGRCFEDLTVARRACGQCIFLIEQVCRQENAARRFLLLSESSPVDAQVTDLVVHDAAGRVSSRAALARFPREVFNAS